MSAAPVDEVSHEIDVELHATFATLVVRRTVQTDLLGGVEAHFGIAWREDMGAAVDVVLTTTQAEIVAVASVEAGGDAKAEACIREAVSALDLLPGRDVVATHRVHVD